MILLKETKRNLELIDFSSLDKKKRNYSSLTALIILVSIVIPVTLIFTCLFLQNSKIMPFFYVLVFIMFICIIMLQPLASVIEFGVLKCYYEEEFKEINLRGIFIFELLKISNILISLGLTIVIFLLIRVM